MEKLLKYLIEKATGVDNAKITVEEKDDSTVNLNISCDQDKIGLIIGKQGKTIKAIQTLLRVRGRLEDKSVFVNIDQV